MLRKTTVLISLVLLLPTLFLGMERPQEKMEFKLIQEKEFDKEIKDVAWGETEDGRLYPKIIVFEDEVRFYDEEGSLLATQSKGKYTRIRLSARGNYVGIPTLIKYPTKEQTGLLKFTVYTERGDKVWEKEEKIEWEGSRTFYVSSKEASLVKADPCDGSLFFFDKSSREINRVDLFKDDEWDYEKSLFCVFSGNGNYFAVNAQERPGDKILAQ